jgi:prephenate dehydrogenase
MRVVIIGAGHMGAWLAEELCLEHDLAVYDTDTRKLTYLSRAKKLLELHEVDAFKPQLVINAVSLRDTRKAFGDVLPLLPGNCLLSDIASIKTGLHELYKEMGKRFISTHPMFGPTFADLKELGDEHAIIIKESDEQGKAFFRSFYRKLHIKVHEYTFEEHDKAMAYCLSIPYASSIVFAACMKEQEAPGTTFRKHLEIAQGLLSKDDHLIADIMFNQYSIRQIEEIGSQISYLARIIRGKDYEAMRRFLKRLGNNVTSSLDRLNQ